MTNVKGVWLVFVALLLAACATATVVTPKNFEQSAAVAYGSLSASYGIVADLVTRERMTKAEGKEYVARLDRARADIDSAMVLYKAGEKANAETQLETVNTALRTVEAALKAKVK